MQILSNKDNVDAASMVKGKRFAGAVVRQAKQFKNFVNSSNGAELKFMERNSLKHLFTRQSDFKILVLGTTYSR
jgi:hypothetical protein